MANARIARFISEVAPPQLVTVMRRRTSKVLDTIKEEEREVCAGINDRFSSNPSPPSPVFASACPATSVGGSVGTSKYFLKDVQRPFSIFNH